MKRNDDIIITTAVQAEQINNLTKSMDEMKKTNKDIFNKIDHMNDKINDLPKLIANENNKLRKEVKLNYACKETETKVKNMTKTFVRVMVSLIIVAIVALFSKVFT